MNRISRFATTVLVSGSLGLTGVGLTAVTAHADRVVWGPPCPSGRTCGEWCPGDSKYPPNGPGDFVSWDWNICHVFYDDWRGVVDAVNEVAYPYPGNPNPTPPVPPPPAPRPAHCPPWNVIIGPSECGGL